MNSCARDRSLYGRYDIRCFMMDKYRRDIKGVRGRGKMVIGNWKRRMCEESLLEVDDGWIIRSRIWRRSGL